MPSGSKKRKSSKKPKPQGGPPELDVGLEEAMANIGEEVGEPSPSPVGIEEDPEAMAERGFDSNEVIGKALQEVAKEDFEIDEADRGIGGQGDPPPLAEPELEIPAGIEAEPPAVIEPEAETAPHEEIPPQIDIPFSESDAKNDVTPEEIKAEEYDAGPVDREPVVDATPYAPLDEIKPDTDIGIDEIESSKESPKLEREFDLDAVPLSSESGIDKSFVDVETKTDATSADIEPESGKAADELAVSAAPEDESGIGEPLVKEGDGAPYLAQETDEAPNEVLVEVEPEAHIKPEAEVEESESEEGLREREPVTEAAPTDVETDGEEKQVEEPETAAPIDIKPEEHEKQIEEPETVAPPDVEPVAEEAQIERELDLDAAPAAEVEEAPVERELATDVPIAIVEPETEAAPLDIDAETTTIQAETDALQDKVPQEIDAAIPENKTETDEAVRESEPEEDATAVKPEPPVEVSPVENEPEVSAEPVSVVAAPEPERQEEPEVKAEDIEAPDPEPEGEALVKEEPEVRAEDVEKSAEIEARTAPPQETEPESKPLDLAEDTSFEPSQVSEPELEAEEIGKGKLEDEASAETKEEETGSVETEACQQDSAEGEGKAATQINPEAEVETTRGIELEADAVVSPESVVEAPVETELDEKGLIDTEADQQDLAGIGPDQSVGKEEDGQLQSQAGEPETDKLESSAFDVHQPSESQPQVADALEVPVVEDEPPAFSASSDAELKEGDIIPPLATDLEAERESTMEVVSENQDSRGDIDLPLAEVVNAEELAKEDGMDQERAVNVGHGEDEALLASARNGGEVEVSSEQELGSEQPLLADAVDAEESAKEEPPVSDQELVSQQPQPLINLDSATGEPEKDIGEEEAVSSTKAEAGSVLNDSDERASYELELPTDFPPTEQVEDVPDIKEFDDNISTSIPEFVETGSREHLGSEPIPADNVDANTPHPEEATSEQPEVLLESAEAAEPAKDLVFMENAGAAEPANDLHPAPVEEIPSDEQVPSLPQPVRQDSGKDEVFTSREVVLANEEPKAGEEEGAAHENDDKVAANSIFPNVAGDALISKASVHLENGKQSIASSEAPSNGVVENGAESGVHQSEANNTDKAEIDAVDSKESKEVEVKPVGADDIPVESAPPVSEGTDIKDFEAFRQESTQEASLPVVISSQDRNVEVANLKNAERPSEGGVLKRRTKFLDCCGMFDLLLKKN